MSNHASDSENSGIGPVNGSRPIGASAESSPGLEIELSASRLEPPRHRLVPVERIDGVRVERSETVTVERSDLDGGGTSEKVKIERLETVFDEHSDSVRIERTETVRVERVHTTARDSIPELTEASSLDHQESTAKAQQILDASGAGDGSRMGGNPPAVLASVPDRPPPQPVEPLDVIDDIEVVDAEIVDVGVDGQRIEVPDRIYDPPTHNAGETRRAWNPPPPPQQRPVPSESNGSALKPQHGNRNLPLAPAAGTRPTSRADSSATGFDNYSDHSVPVDPALAAQAAAADGGAADSAAGGFFADYMDGDATGDLPRAPIDVEQTGSYPRSLSSQEVPLAPTHESSRENVSLRDQLNRAVDSPQLEPLDWGHKASRPQINRRPSRDVASELPPQELRPQGDVEPDRDLPQVQDLPPPQELRPQGDVAPDRDLQQPRDLPPEGDLERAQELPAAEPADGRVSAEHSSLSKADGPGAEPIQEYRDLFDEYLHDPLGFFEPSIEFEARPERSSQTTSTKSLSAAQARRPDSAGAQDYPKPGFAEDRGDPAYLDGDIGQGRAELPSDDPHDAPSWQRDNQGASAAVRREPARRSEPRFSKVPSVESGSAASPARAGRGSRGGNQGPVAGPYEDYEDYEVRGNSSRKSSSGSSRWAADGLASRIATVAAGLVFVVVVGLSARFAFAGPEIPAGEIFESQNVYWWVNSTATSRSSIPESCAVSLQSRGVATKQVEYADLESIARKDIPCAEILDPQS